MRILYLGNVASPHLRAQMRFFAERGHDVHACHVGRAEPPEAAGVRLHRPFGARERVRGGWLLSWPALRRLLRELGPDIVHSYSVVPAGYLGVRAGARRHVVTAGGSDVLRAPRRNRRLIREVVRSADVLTAPSRHLLAALERHGAPADRLRFVPTPGVERGWLRRADGLTRAQAVARLGLPPDRPLVVCPRGIRPVYRPDVVVEALPGLVASRPDALAVLLYEPSRGGRELRALRARADALGLEGNLRLEPYARHEDMPLLYRAASVCVSASESDGAPTSVHEALSLGAAVVVSDLPWAREPEYRGLRMRVVPVGDAGALARALEAALAHDARDDEQHNRRLSAERFDRTLVLGRIEAAYEALVR